MNLKNIGYNAIVNKYVEENRLDKSSVGRIIAVFRDMYTVKTDSAELKATNTGNLQNSIEDKSELPIVGDWVCLNKYDDQNAFITQVFPRNNFIHFIYLYYKYLQSKLCHLVLTNIKVVVRYRRIN